MNFSRKRAPLPNAEMASEVALSKFSLTSCGGGGWGRKGEGWEGLGKGERERGCVWGLGRKNNLRFEGVL